MSDSERPPLDDLLSSFALGPSWARGDAGTDKKPSAGAFRDRGGDRPERSGKDRGDRDGRDRERRDGRDGRRFERGPRGKFDAPRREIQEVRPADGVRVELVPDPEAVHLIGKEIHREVRVYPLFDVAKILLAERGRCRAVFEVEAGRPALWRGKLDESLFLTREEALNHLWQSDLRARFVEQESVTCDPPKGNFQAVARCGLSGEWLGPPNFHTYQTNLHRLHRERFSHLPFAAYSAKVRTERGEEAVNQWLESMTTRTRWRLTGEGDEAWVDDESAVRRQLGLKHFEEAFEETRRAEVNAGIPAGQLSPSLLESMKAAGNHARQHPALLIPAICKAVEAAHLPVFKRKGKLHTGPSRPHPLPPGQTLAERPGVIVEWIRNNTPAKLEGLWRAVMPDGSTAPSAEFAAALFWLLQQGHILLFPDDTLMVQEIRQDSPSPAAHPEAGGKNKKRKKKSSDAASREPASAAADAEADEPSDDSEAEPEDAAPTGETEPSSDEVDPEPAAEIEAGPADDVSATAGDLPAEAVEPAPESAAPAAEEIAPAAENPAAEPTGVDEPPAV